VQKVKLREVTSRHHVDAAAAREADATATRGKERA
jgi:hypothetical protein